MPPPNPKPTRILVVDDSEASLELLTAMLELTGYEVMPAASGAQALEVVRRHPPDLILMDIDMPEMNGFQLCRRIKDDPLFRNVPVIFLSGFTDTVEKLQAFSCGAVDYITKPFEFEEVRARVETQLKIRRLQLELEDINRHLSDRVQEQVKEISESQIATIFALSKLAESRDGDTGKHLERVSAFCRILAAELGQTGAYADFIDRRYVEDLGNASPLHDIGKVGIPDSILRKPGKLTAEEFATMKTHALIGAETLEAVRARYPGNAFLAMGIAIARSHHEKWDGSGYPDGKRGEDIPLSARLLAVADVYDALRSKRPYKEPFTHEKAAEIIVAGSGAHFDPAVVEVFVKAGAVMEQTSRELQDH